MFPREWWPAEWTKKSGKETPAYHLFFIRIILKEGKWSGKGFVRIRSSILLTFISEPFPFKDVFLGLARFRGVLNPLLVVSAPNKLFIVECFLPGFSLLGGYEFPRISLGFGYLALLYFTYLCFYFSCFGNCLHPRRRPWLSLRVAGFPCASLTS